jgi:predicted O-linked N-acetylglucosamine transferase (SPINDLY family)
MGVPVLALAGDSFISRQGASLLMNVGLPEWVATDPDDYVTRAIAHAADRACLAGLRRRLRDRAAASPAFDAVRFASNLAAALRGMWRAWCSEPRASSTARDA